MCNYDVSTNTPAPCSSKVDSTRAPEVEAYLYPEKGWDMRRLLQDHQNGRETLFQPCVRSLEARVRTTLETASENATMRADNRTDNSRNNGCDSRRRRARPARHCPPRNTNTAKHGGTVGVCVLPILTVKPNEGSELHAESLPLIRENILYNCDIE